jgi:hypothetical protein
VESSDTRPIFQQTWTIPKYAEVLLRLRKVANGVEKCEPYPGMRWINASEDVLHRARPEDLVKAVGEILGIDRKEVGEYAQQLVCSYLSSQFLPIEDGEGNPGFSYSAVGIAVFEPGPASYPSIRLTPQAAEGIHEAFRVYFEGQGEVTCLLSPVTLPVGFLKQCGPGIARHILYTADILQSSEAGLVEDMAPRVFARAINGVLPQFPATTEVAELEKAGSAREPCLPEHTHVLPFLISMTRMGDPAPIKWASRLFRDSKDAAEAKGKLLLQVATSIYSVNPEIFGQLEMDPDVSFLSGGPHFNEAKK